MMTLLRLWWRQPCHYSWLSAHLQDRELQTVTRNLMAAITAALAVLPVAMIFSPQGPRGTLGLTVSVLVTMCCLVFALLWLLRWPTRNQAATFAVVSTLCVAATCLAETDPLGALMGCVAFAAVGGFIAFYLTARYLLFNVAIALTTACWLAVELAGDGRPVQAACKLLLIIIAIVAVPFTAQTLMHLLGADAINSDLDPLTGLNNRRALPRLSRELLLHAHRRDRRDCFAAAVIDLDNFKGINDTRGHAAGDHALIEIGRALREASGPTAVVARTGGEEFLIIDLYAQDGVAAAAERYRAAIAAAPFGITASIGTASTGLPEGSDPAVDEVVDTLIHLADAAMYDAKRAGGNQTRSAPARSMRADRGL